MSLYRRAAKRDRSEKQIVDALRKCGWSVLQVSVKDGPDLFISRLCNRRLQWGDLDIPIIISRTIAVEVKTGRKKLRPGQEAFKAQWQGEYVVCRSIADVLALNGER